MRYAAGLTLLLVLSAPLAAQEGAPAVNVTKLGVDLDRIQRGLAVADILERQQQDGLKLNIQVQVYGQAPRIDFFQDFALDTGPLRWGAPTHQQMIDHTTPEEFRSGTFPVGGLAVLGLQKLFQSKQRSDCKAQLDEYRAQVMAGQNVSPPKCAR